METWKDKLDKGREYLKRNRVIIDYKLLFGTLFIETFKNGGLVCESLGYRWVSQQEPKIFLPMKVDESDLIEISNIRDKWATLRSINDGTVYSCKDIYQQYVDEREKSDNQ